MALRVTSVRLYVLHTGVVPLEQRFLSGYLLDSDEHETYEGVIGSSTYVVPPPVARVDGIAGSGSYAMAGFLGYEGLVGEGRNAISVYTEHTQYDESRYSLDTYTDYRGLQYSSTYSIDIQTEHGGIVAAGNHDFLAYAPATVHVSASYGLDVLTMAQGYLEGDYNVEVYVDQVATLINQYALQTFGENNLVFAQGRYSLYAWEPQDQRSVSAYALNVFTESAALLHGQYAIDFYKEATARLGASYDLNALQMLSAIIENQYSLLLFSEAESRIGASYALPIYEAFNQFTSFDYDLNAYAAATGLFETKYELFALVARSGYVTGNYAILALEELLGSFQGSYLLDATAEFHTWVLNHNTGAPARYENYGFTAFARVGNLYLGSREDGLYLLEADDDNGQDIAALATTGRTDFGASELKRVLGAYLGLGSTGQAHLTLKTDQAQASGPYQLRQSVSGYKTERAKFNRGMKTRSLQIDLQNVDGEDQEIDGVELDVTVIRRKLQR